MNQEVSNKILTIPNLITLVRLLLLPVFVVLLLQYQNDIAAFIVFLVAASSDFIDGKVARSLGQVSKLGQQLDPLVDRLLILTAVITVFMVGRVPIWMLILLVGRDIVMLVLTAYMKFKFNRSFKVVFIGKVATALNMTGFCFLILNMPQLPGLGLIDSSWLPGWGAGSAAIGIWFLYPGLIIAWITGGIYLYWGTRPEPRQNTDRGRGSSGRSSSNKQQNLETRKSTQNRSVGSQNPRPKANKTQSLPKNLSANTLTSQRRNSHYNQSMAMTENNSNRPLILRILNTPKKLIVSIAILVFVLAGVAFYSYDVTRNLDTIHLGVKVAGLDVGGLTQQEAALQIDNLLSNQASSAPVSLFASEQDKKAGINDQTEQLDKGVGDYNAEQANTSARSWNITTSTLDVVSNGVSLADAAYSVGRDQDFIFGRLAANLFGVNISGHLDFSQSKQENLEDLLTKSVGTPMVNANIQFDGNQFTAVDGIDGYVVDEEKFRKQLQDAYLGSDSSDREIVLPMVERKMRVDLRAAQNLVTQVNQQILEPVTISYQNASWQLNKAFLGSCISTVVEQEGANRWKLVPVVDAELLKTNLPQVIGDLNPGSAGESARFEVVDGALQIKPSITGTGISYKGLAEQLRNILFNEDAKDQAREASMYIGTLEPDFTTAMAREYSFPDKIAEYTTEYRWVPDSRIVNIHLASDLISSSIIEPGGTWSFNELAGDCTAERGFQEGNEVIDGELVSGIGGGICQVATTVYNAVYDSGLPITERTNHSLYISSYPDGRDAAIAYPYADLKFQNDTQDYMILVMSYTDESVTASIWGVNPGYQVESQTSDWTPGAKYSVRKIENPDMLKGTESIKTKGEDGKTISVMRTVFDKTGNMIRQSTIWSVYEPKKEIVEIGTLEPPTPTPTPTPTPALLSVLAPEPLPEPSQAESAPSA